MKRLLNIGRMNKLHIDILKDEKQIKISQDDNLFNLIKILKIPYYLIYNNEKNVRISIENKYLFKLIDDYYTQNESNVYSLDLKKVIIKHNTQIKKIPYVPVFLLILFLQKHYDIYQPNMRNVNVWIRENLYDNNDIIIYRFTNHSHNSISFLHKKDIKKFIENYLKNKNIKKKITFKKYHEKKQICEEYDLFNSYTNYFGDYKIGYKRLMKYCFLNDIDIYYNTFEIKYLDMKETYEQKMKFFKRENLDLKDLFCFNNDTLFKNGMQHHMDNNNDDYFVSLSYITKYIIQKYDTNITIKHGSLNTSLLRIILKFYDKLKVSTYDFTKFSSKKYGFLHKDDIETIISYFEHKYVKK